MKSRSEIISEIKQWKKEYLKSIIVGIVIGFLAIGLAVIALFYGFFAVIAKETMLKSLIEAEATILGFFGLIVIYALTSFDNRTERLEERLFDLTEKAKHTQVPEELSQLGIFKSKGGMLGEALHNIQQRKTRTIKTSLVVGAYLISSLLLSILGLGMPDIPSAFLLCWFAIAMFFVSIAGMLKMFYDLAKPPEARTEK